MRIIFIRHPAPYYWWVLKFLPWWRKNPSLTRFLPKWVNRRLQKWGEVRRSAKAALEPETNMPFPYNNAWSLIAYCENRKAAEPDLEPYWREQQRLMDLKWAYRNLPGPHPDPSFTLAAIPAAPALSADAISPSATGANPFQEPYETYP